MKERREWWLGLAQRLQVGTSRKVKHPQDGYGKTASVLIWNSPQGWGAKCFRRNTTDFKSKEFINLKEIEAAQATSNRTDVPEDVGTAYNPASPDWVMAMVNNYLLSRGLDPHKVASNPYQQVSVSRERMRLLFKGVDTTGLTGYLGRDFTGKAKAKAVNYKVGGKALANMVIRRNNSNVVVLTEDNLSALKIAMLPESYTVPGKVISLNGTAGSAGVTLECIDKVVLIWLDGDAAGQRGAIKLARDLHHLAECVIVNGEGDPKDYSEEEIQRIIEAGNETFNRVINISEVLHD